MNSILEELMEQLNDGYSHVIDDVELFTKGLQTKINLGVLQFGLNDWKTEIESKWKGRVLFIIFRIER